MPYLVSFDGKYCLNVLLPLKGMIASLMLMFFRGLYFSKDILLTMLVSSAMLLSTSCKYCPNFLNCLNDLTFFTLGTPNLSSVNQYIFRRRRLDSHQDEQTKISLHFSFVCWKPCRINYRFNFYYLAFSFV